jgi:excinuclease UvrABC nuclease subunit
MKRRPGYDRWLGAIHSPCVYRCFDARGVLLYIGSSVNVARRCQLHKSHSLWWPQVRGVVVTTFRTMQEARRSERRSIFTEQPTHNVQNKDVVNS